MSGSAAFFKDPLNVYRVPELERFPWLEHGFGTRHSILWPDPARLVMLKQIHSARILEADGRTGYTGEGDALIASRPGALIGVRTADCVPLLLVDARRRAVAAVHAGWRGAAAGIAGKTVEALGSAYGTEPSDLHAAIGPCIGVCCYEVGAEVARQFTRWLPELGILDGPVKLDLAAVNRNQLLGAGVPGPQIYSSGQCTFCASGELHSYRRDGPRAGRVIAAIGIRSKTEWH